MGTDRPAGVAVLVALQAVLGIRQHLLGDEVPARRARQRGEEILLARRRPRHLPTPWVLRLPHQHTGAEHRRHRRPAQTDLPFDAPSGQPVENEQPTCGQRRHHMRPVSDRAHLGILDHDHPFDPGQDDAAGEQGESRGEEAVAHPHRPPVGPVVGVAGVGDAEGDHRHHDQRPQDQVDEEHVEIEPVLVGLARRPLEQRHPHQVGGVDRQQRKQPEQQEEHLAQPRADSLAIAGAISGSPPLLRHQRATHRWQASMGTVTVRGSDSPRRSGVPRALQHPLRSPRCDPPRDRRSSVFPRSGASAR